MTLLILSLAVGFVSGFLVAAANPTHAERILSALRSLFRK